MFIARTVQLVLMPGLDGTGLMFEPMVERLGAERCHVVEYPSELRGLNEFLARVPEPSEPYALVAESFSGPLATLLASRRSGGLRGLVLIATFATAPRKWLLRLLSTVFAGLLSWLPSRLASWFLLGPKAGPRLSQLLASALQRLPGSAVAARLRLLLSLDVREALREVKVPVLVLEAQSDWLVPRSATQALLACRPGTQQRRLAGPHLLAQRSASAVAEAVNGFVLQLGSGPEVRR